MKPLMFTESFFNSDCLAQPDSRCYRSVLLLIVVVGLLLRLGAIYYAQGYHHFMINDEVNALRFIFAWLGGDEQARYLAQPAFNNGQLPGPLWTLFGVTLFKLGGNSAEGVLYAMAIINSLTIILVYKLAQQFFPPTLALMTGGLYAIAPWTVYYSYGLYNPVPLDLIGALLFLVLWQSFTRERVRQVFWVPVLCAVIPQFHMIGIFVIPAVLLILFLAPVRLNRGWFSAGILAGMLIYVPYLAGDMQHGWQNLQAMLTGGEAREYSGSVLKVFTAPVTLLSSAPAGWSGDGMEPTRYFAEKWFGHFYVLALLAAWTLLNGFIFLFSMGKRVLVLIWQQRFRMQETIKRHGDLMFVGLLVFVPLLLFLLTGHNFSTRYAIVLLPLFYLLPGFFLQNIRRPAIVKFWLISLSLVGIMNLYLLGSYFAYQQMRFASSDEFMPSFRTLESLRQTMQADAGKGKAFTVELDHSLRENLTAFEYKLVATVKQYSDQWQKYRQHRSGPAEATYIIETASSAANDHVLYRRGDISIRRQSSTSR